MRSAVLCLCAAGLFAAEQRMAKGITRVIRGLFYTSNFPQLVLRKYFVSVLLLSLTLTMTQSIAQWRINQRSHVPTWLSDSDVQQIAGLTDIRSIRAILKPILVERQVGTPQHDQVATYLKQKAEEFGFTAEWDSFYAPTPHGQKLFRNLIATYDPMVHRRLVLACHYDSKILPGKVFIGATDSALPCALLLDIARTLGPWIYARSEKHITLQLVFLDGEEAFREWTSLDSIYGAKHLADLWNRRWYPSTSGSAFELSREIDRVDVLVLLDLLGAKSPKIQNTFGHGAAILFNTFPEIESRLKGISSLKNIPRIFHQGSTLNAVEDDHIPFLQRGVPIMHLISVPFPSVWHTPADNESILDNDTIANLASIIRVFVAQYLGIRPPPQNNNQQQNSFLFG